MTPTLDQLHEFRTATDAPLFSGLPGDVAVSFEFFPPKSEKMEEQLWDAVTQLKPLGPSFVSVTYGAGGSTRERTHATVARIIAEAGLPAAAHLTCVAASKAEIREVAAGQPGPVRPLKNQLAVVGQVGDGDGQGLGGGLRRVAIVGRGDEDLIDVVGIRIRRYFEVRSGHEAQRAAGRADGEARGVRAAGDAVGDGLAGIRIRRTEGGHGSGVLRHRDRRRAAPAVAGEDG
jgi:hypothetical protein